MNPAARAAAALIRAAANFAKDPDPVVRADARTSQCDARAALNLANGVAIEDIDPTTGHDYSAAAYEDVRESWRYSVGQHGFSEYYDQPRIERAYGNWLAHRPDLAAGDDWLAGVVKLEPIDQEA